MSKNKIKLTQHQTFNFGSYKLRTDDGKHNTKPELTIEVANCKHGWVWAVTIRNGWMGYGYAINNQQCLDRAVPTKQNAINRACAEIQQQLKGKRTRKALHQWLDSLAGDNNKQLALFPDAPQQQCLLKSGTPNAACGSQ